MNKTQSKQNFTSLLKRVRAILPGDVKKTDTLEYEISGKVKINFNYYCRWDKTNLEKQLKECHPVSIRISPATTYLNSIGYQPISKKVFTTRTIPKQKATGDFNLESIAVAVTRGIEAVDKYVKNCKASEAKAEADEKLRTQELDKLEKELKPFNVKRLNGWGRRLTKFRTNNNIVDIDVFGPGDNGKFHYDIHFEELSKEELIAILQAVRIASGFIRKED